MAEAAVERPESRFFCHQCKVEITPTLPEYTCPRCQNGFIEEIYEEMGGDDDFASEVNAITNQIDPGVTFTELVRNAFLESLRMHTNTDGQVGSESNASAPSPDMEVIDSNRVAEDGPVLSFPPPPTRQTRVTLRRLGAQQPQRQPHPALEAIIQQLLTGLTGGTAFTGRGGAFPFPVMNLHGNPGDYAWGPQGLDSIITQLMNQLEGSGPPPAEKTQIDSLPMVKISKEDVDKTVQCSVCMEDFVLDEEVKKLPCNHHYHKNCIVPWLELHGTCPVCRKTLTGEDSTQQAASAAPNSSPASSSQPNNQSSSNPAQPSLQDLFSTGPNTFFEFLDDDEFD